jgi:hypothetical protein
MKKALLIISFIVSNLSLFAQLTTVTFDTQTQSVPYQTFTIPCGVTSITINAVGASGGSINSQGGKGARMIGTFSVTPGDIIRLRAGRYGVDGGINGVGGAGGGASWAINATTNQVLVVAGGGGGASINPNNTLSSKLGWNATITNTGTSGGETGQLTNRGGGGGGWTTNGGGGMLANLGGYSYSNGGAGAVGSSTNPSFNAGGFGGGGGGAQYLGMGGGGGGYSGGKGGYITSNVLYSSEGGGSYNSGTNQTNSVAQVGPQFNTGYNGQIVITFTNPLAQPTISGISSICSGSSTTLTVQNPLSGNTYVWSNGSTGTSIQVTSAGSFTVYGTSSCGASAVSGAFSVAVNQSPSVSVSNNGSITFCQGDSIQLISNATTGVSYQWKKDNIDVVGATNSNYFVQNSGSFSIVVTSSNGCSTTSNSINVVVNPLPSSTISSTSPLQYCTGDIILNDLAVSQNQNYLWNTGEITQLITVNQAGTYSVLVTDANGCQNSDSIQITVNPLPVVNAGNDQTICQGNVVTLTANGANTYSWNNSVTNNVAFTPTVSNNYVVTGTDVNGCQDSDTVQVTVNPTSASQLTQTAVSSYTLNGQTYTQTGTYTQVLQNQFGCDSTITLNLTINSSGINELNGEIVSIYPNPASNQITIAYSGQIQKVEIMDTKGARVFTSMENNKEIVLPANMPSGYYLVLVQTTEGVFLKELVVKK